MSDMPCGAVVSVSQPQLAPSAVAASWQHVGLWCAARHHSPQFIEYALVLYERLIDCIDLFKAVSEALDLL